MMNHQFLQPDPDSARDSLRPLYSDGEREYLTMQQFLTTNGACFSISGSIVRLGSSLINRRE
jgi:hypothetical protein